MVTAGPPPSSGVHLTLAAPAPSTPATTTGSQRRGCGVDLPGWRPDEALATPCMRAPARMDTPRKSLASTSCVPSEQTHHGRVSTPTLGSMMQPSHGMPRGPRALFYEPSLIPPVKPLFRHPHVALPCLSQPNEFVPVRPGCCLRKGLREGSNAVRTPTLGSSVVPLLKGWTATVRKQNGR